jgi:hypothetical protein
MVVVAYTLHLTFPHFSTVFVICLQSNCLMFLQEKYSVQFDDLFKIAWEDNVDNKILLEGEVQNSAEDEATNGNLLSYIIHSSHISILSWETVIAKQ